MRAPACTPAARPIGSNHAWLPDPSCGRPTAAPRTSAAHASAETPAPEEFDDEEDEGDDEEEDDELPPQQRVQQSTLAIPVPRRSTGSPLEQRISVNMGGAYHMSRRVKAKKKHHPVSRAVLAAHAGTACRPFARQAPAGAGLASSMAGSASSTRSFSTT